MDHAISDTKTPKLSYKHLQPKYFALTREEQCKALQEISKAHVDSFNFLLSEGLGKIVQFIHPLEVEVAGGDRIAVEIKDIKIGNPVVHKDSIHASTFQVYPAECRSRGITYRAKLQVSATWSRNGIAQDNIEKVIGEVPVMVKSNACNLAKLKPVEYPKHGEEAEEFGGYFIINGNERIVRMLIMQRRNYPIAMTRPGWKHRGKMFTEYGVSIRCVRPDQTGANMVLHYLSNGSAQLMFTYKMELFFVPIMLILKALCDISDKLIYSVAVVGKDSDSFYKGCISNMLRNLQKENLYVHQQVKEYLGNLFRVKMNLPSWYTDAEIADFLLKECICVHLESNVDKLVLLLFMMRKLFSVAKQECAIETPDNPMNQEVLVAGHLVGMVIKDKLEAWLFSIKNNLDKKTKLKGPSLKITSAIMNECVSRAMDLTRPVEYVFATGNFISRNGNLMQNTGLTVIADKLNFWRYVSHFRCVHRGAFFAEMRTTTVRKLLPEAWGFICPVHTPDGTPCGLLNHMSALCEVTNTQPPVLELESILKTFILSPNVLLPSPIQQCYILILDGRVLGWVSPDSAPDLINKLRYLKISQSKEVPSTLEIGFVPMSNDVTQFPGIYLFTTPARMMRPVRNLSTNTIELIGSMEQVYLNICVSPDEFHDEMTTHQELRPTSMLSVLANMIPFSDYNQSPRNMYECQMGKQTMGTPCHAFRYRSDNKLYRIQTPQSPMVRPTLYDYYQMDDYPLGTNAVVAVISCTGYDMEDAMIINKHSLERGFKHGSVIKSEFINLRTISGDHGSQYSLIFARDDSKENIEKFVDADGLPHVGTRLSHGDPICCYKNLATGVFKSERYKSVENAYVSEVKVLGNDTGTDVLQKICITYIMQRNPIIGDKFASRHGQKGICSVQQHADDLPFSDSGLLPDIVFNPHGFPSRMTIGMIIESMAGKIAAINGTAHDSAPFQFSEEDTAADYFGNLLKNAGYNYHGTERIYSGTTGEELEADIFVGIVYYQRLRHMVADKFQMRTTGPVDILTHQPVKGRKKAGGVRFGEMERDSLLAHGTGFLLQDRLFNCSDSSLAYACLECNSVLSPIFDKPPPEDLPTSREIRRRWACNTCKTNEDIHIVSLPYVFRFLAAEALSMNSGLGFSLD